MTRLVRIFARIRVNLGFRGTSGGNENEEVIANQNLSRRVDD